MPASRVQLLFQERILSAFFILCNSWENKCRVMPWQQGITWCNDKGRPIQWQACQYSEKLCLVWVCPTQRCFTKQNADPELGCFTTQNACPTQCQFTKQNAHLQGHYDSFVCREHGLRGSTLSPSSSSLG